MTTAEKIKMLRKNRQMTQTELGEKLGVKKNAVSKWECGRVEDIPAAKIKAMAALFNVPISYLVDDTAKRMVGSTKSSINMYERGEREPGIEMLKVLASFFHVDMNYLLGESGPQTGPEMIRRKISARDISPAQLFEWPDNGSLKAGDSAMNEMYNRIEILCRQNGINITTMCRESGVPRGNLTDLKKGRSKELSIKNLVRLSSYFNVPLDYFAGNTPASSYGHREKRGGCNVRDAIANNLRRAREDAGLTQAGAAEAIGITPQAIRNYERGISGIDVETLLALCAVYKVRLESVIPVDAISQEQNRKEATNEQTSNL